MSGDAAGAPGRPRLMLALLLIVYTFNFVDRQIFAILAGPIKAELALSDTRLGMLGGLAFAIFYTTLGVPLGLLADRTRRSWVIAGSLAVWSGFTALCGLAGGFGQLFLCRLGVGVGEAGGVAPSHALISDTFPPGRQARALSIYSLGIPFGSSLGILFGGYVAAHVDWRAALVSVGLAGVAFTPLFMLLVREPKRPGNENAARGWGRAFAVLAAKRSFWLLAFGAASASISGYGIGFWLPSLMERSFGLDLTTTARFSAALLLIGGAAGMLGGGWLADRLGSGDRARHALLPALAFAVAVPLFAAGILSRSATAAFLLFLLPQALAYVWFGTVIVAVQHLVPPTMRATASASFLLIVNLIGLGLGSTAIGRLSEMLKGAFGSEALRYALLGGLGFYLLAALLMALAASALRRDWVD